MKKQKQQRPSKLDQLAASAAQDCAHASTATVNSRKRVLEFELAEVERSITALQATTAMQRERRGEIEATLRGLAEVVARR